MLAGCVDQKVQTAAGLSAFCCCFALVCFLSATGAAFKCLLGCRSYFGNTDNKMLLIEESKVCWPGQATVQNMSITVEADKLLLVATIYKCTWTLFCAFVWCLLLLLLGSWTLSCAFVWCLLLLLLAKNFASTVVLQSTELVTTYLLISNHDSTWKSTYRLP